MATKKKTTRKRKSTPKRKWHSLSFRRSHGEPLLTWLHKILIFIIAFATVSGLVWDKLKSADARYAKSVEAQVVHQQLKDDIVALNSAFQYDQLGNAIDRKRDQIRSIDQDLANPNLPAGYKAKQRMLRDELQIEVEHLLKKQEKYSP